MVFSKAFPDSLKKINWVCSNYLKSLAANLQGVCLFIYLFSREKFLPQDSQMATWLKAWLDATYNSIHELCSSRNIHMVPLVWSLEILRWWGLPNVNISQEILKLREELGGERFESKNLSGGVWIIFSTTHRTVIAKTRFMSLFG